MKKGLIVVVLIAILISLAGCSESENVAYSINAAINEQGNVVDDLLIEAYRSGEWDGSFVANEAHCASIEDGKLWVDCDDVYLAAIPDSANDKNIYSSVLNAAEDGSWIEDPSNGEIRLDKKGETIKKIVIPFRSFYAEQLADESIVVRSDDTVLVYNLDGVVLHRIDAVTDMAILGNECHVATWEDDNYVISSVGEVTSVDAEGIVRCQGQQVTVKAIDNGGDVDAEVVAAILAYENGWDGELRISDGHFRKVSYYGDVVIDNKVRGNVHLWYGYELSSKGVNVARSVDGIYVVEGETLTIYSSANRGAGQSIKIPANQGAEFEWIDIECCHLLLYKENGTMDFVRVNFADGSVEILASNVVDANTAYDSIYFMGADQKVYARLWNSETEAHLYCEGARCISPHTDESEGAILDSCGWLNYGSSARIYSPYSPEYRGE